VKQRSVTARFHDALVRRDGNQCHYCHAFVDGSDLRINRSVSFGKISVYIPAWSLVADHVIPVSKGGPTILENLVLACNFCNARKNNQDYFTFKKRMDEWIDTYQIDRYILAAYERLYG
jgi:hypothetical protein